MSVRPSCTKVQNRVVYYEALTVAQHMDSNLFMFQDEHTCIEMDTERCKNSFVSYTLPEDGRHMCELVL